jgi:hypothetical protein
MPRTKQTRATAERRATWTQRKERVLNILQIVEVRHEVDSWEVWLTKGDPIRLASEWAEKLFQRLPGAEPKQLNVH